MKTPGALLLCSLLVLASPPAGAGEEAPPNRGYTTTVSAFPAPGAAAAFDVAGRIESKGAPVGTFRLAAGADSSGETPRWALVEERKTTFDDVSLEREARATADGALRPEHGTLREVDAFGEEIVHEWKKDGTGYRVETSSPSRRPMGRSASEAGSCLTSLAALVLFARLAPAASATYETRLFEPGWDYLEAEQPFLATRLILDRSGEAVRLQAVQERATYEVLLDPQTLALNQLTIREKGRPVLVLKPGPVAEGPTTTEDLFAAPSPTPRGCAARVALAFATVDDQLFEAVIHWPTLRKNMQASITGTVTDEAFRDSILGQFRKQGAGREPQAADDARAFLQQEAPSFSVERKEEGTAVTLSEAWGRMRLTCTRVEGAWYLARLPGR